jgi:hypothetical protein
MESVKGGSEESDRTINSCLGRRSGPDSEFRWFMNQKSLKQAACVIMLINDLNENLRDGEMYRKNRNFMGLKSDITVLWSVCLLMKRDIENVDLVLGSSSS